MINFSENMSVVTPGLAPTSGMANDTVNKLLDFSQKLDIGLLVSIFFYTRGGDKLFSIRIMLLLGYVF